MDGHGQLKLDLVGYLKMENNNNWNWGVGRWKVHLGIVVRRSTVRFDQNTL